MTQPECSCQRKRHQGDQSVAQYRPFRANSDDEVYALSGFTTWIKRQAAFKTLTACQAAILASTYANSGFDSRLPWRFFFFDSRHESCYTKNASLIVWGCISPAPTLNGGVIYAYQHSFPSRWDSELAANLETEPTQLTYTHIRITHSGIVRKKILRRNHFHGNVCDETLVTSKL